MVGLFKQPTKPATGLCEFLNRIGIREEDNKVKARVGERRKIGIKRRKRNNWMQRESFDTEELKSIHRRKDGKILRRVVN